MHDTRGDLIAFPCDDPGGRVLVCTSMWPEPGRENYGVFVRRQVDSLRRAGVPCRVLVIRGWRSSVAYARAAALLLGWSMRGRARQFDLVHAHGGEAAVAARFLLATPLLISYCGSDLLGAPSADGRLSTTWRARRRLIALTASMATATVTKSAPMSERLPPSRRPRNHVIPNGIDRDLFRPLDRLESRRRLKLPPETPIVVWVGNPGVGLKRFVLAEEACRHAVLQQPRLRLVTVHGRRPEEIPLYLSAADCLLVTSSSEGSPNVVKEALACDLPVVSTDVGDVDVLLDGVSPSHVCSADPVELAAAVLDIVSHGLRSNGRDTSRWLDERLIASRLLGLYGELGVSTDQQ